jgi:hypothetical protein
MHPLSDRDRELMLGGVLSVYTPFITCFYINL